MKWELYDNAVRAATLVAQDGDIARDAALAALEECGDAPEAHILRRARDRAKDLIRSARRRPQELHGDMDLIASSTNVEQEAADREQSEQLAGAIGLKYATIMAHVAAGFTNAEMAARWCMSEEYVRRLRKDAEQATERHLTGGH